VVTAISAHPGGGEHGLEGTYEAYRSALATGTGYVEWASDRPWNGESSGAIPA